MVYDVLQEPILRRRNRAYEVEGATTADEARRLVQEAKPPFDVFLIDQNLGLGPNGIELLVELRRLSPSSDAMVFTGYGDPAEGQWAIDAGACDYFTKPLDQPRLLAQLRRLQRERSTRDERNWLQTLTRDCRRNCSEPQLQEAVARCDREGALRFGFLRARLRMLRRAGKEAHDDPELIGVSQAGYPVS